MTKRQAGKGKKRRKSWHRRGEEKRFYRDPLPEVGSGADPTAGAPIPLARTGKTTGTKRRGQSL